MSKNIILVPTDFSKVGDCALNHAVKVAPELNADVHLLHVVAKQKDVDENKDKLEALAASKSTPQVTVHPSVRIGNIFDDIGDMASELEASLIIMGTHGVKGIQHLVGSYAMKVVVNSDAPFIIVQEKEIKDNGYDDIVLPIDHDPKSKQKLTVTAMIAKVFKSRIKLFMPYETDEFLKNKANAELSFAKKYLDERGMGYTVDYAEEKGNFAKQTVKFASKVDADLIAVVNMSDRGLMSDLFGSDEMDLIANDAQIPVLITNPTQKFVSESFGG
jgi:nucleotide-binding universal stress UspA family protein